MLEAKDTTLVEKLGKAGRAGRQEGRQDVVEWGNEDCPHLWIDDNGVPVTHPKHECSQCWQSKEWGIE